MPTKVTDVAKCVASIEALTAALPSTVPEATQGCNIHRLVTSVCEGDPYQTFNRIFDILFKEDAQCRDKDGRLVNIQRGRYGMGKLISYLKNVPWAEKSMVEAYDLVKLRLDRVIKELETLSGKTTAQALQKSKPAKPTGKKPQTASGPSTKSTKKPSKPSTSILTLLDKNLAETDDSDAEFRPTTPDRDLSVEPYEPYAFDEEGNEIIPGDREPRKRKRIVDPDIQGGEGTAPKKRTKVATDEGLPRRTPSVTVIEIDDDDDDEPVGKKRGPQSNSRSYFKEPYPITEKGNPRWAFECKLCTSVHTFERAVGKSTAFDDEKKQPALGNLATHLRAKHPNRGPPPSDLPKQPGDLREISVASAQVMEKYLAEGKLNPAVVRDQKGFYQVFASWILEDDLPFTTGETAGIARLFSFMQVKYTLPTDTTVRNALAKVFIAMHSQVKQEIKNVKSKIACSTDTWTTKSMMFSFAGTIASWVTEDWELVERVVDFHPIADKEHEGEYAAKGFAISMSEMGVLEKIALTLDNASANDTLITALSKILINQFDIQFVPGNSQIRCLNHVLNLVVQKVLATLNEAEDPDNLDYFDKSLPVHYSAEDDPDQLELEREKDEDIDEDAEEETDDKTFDELLTSNATQLSATQKLRTICTKIASSPQRRLRFRRAARRIHKEEKTPDGKSHIAELMVVRDVQTRWNYTHAMIKRALILRKPIESWVHENAELWSLSLLPTDWALLKRICDLLEPFTQVTLQMSMSSTPTLPWVLPMYEYMRRHLQSYSTDLHNPLRTTADAGLIKLNKYYFKARECQFNVIATILHPGLGYTWFKKLGGNRAEMAHTIFEHAYIGYSKNPLTKKPVPSTKLAASSSRFLDAVRLAHVAPPNGNDADSNGPPVTSAFIGELERFLMVEDSSVDVLVWWKLHDVEFPVIARMARDFLAIPGTSVSVERLFSKSRHICADLRSSLRAPTITKALLSKVWIKAGLFKIT